MSGKDTFLKLVRRVTAIAFLLVPLALLIWIGQSMMLNSQRQDLIEKKEFGFLREERAEDYAGETFATSDGEIMLYEFASDQDLNRISIDEASDLTWLHAASGRERRIANDDERKVIWLEVIGRTIESEDRDEPARYENFAYVARLATREMYAEGISDIVVGTLPGLEQRTIAEDAPFVDAVAVGDNDQDFALVYWDNDRSARRVVINGTTLATISSDTVNLPPPDTFSINTDITETPAIDEADEAVADIFAEMRNSEGGQRVR